MNIKWMKINIIIVIIVIIVCKEKKVVLNNKFLSPWIYKILKNGTDN